MKISEKLFFLLAFLFTFLLILMAALVIFQNAPEGRIVVPFHFYFWPILLRLSIWPAGIIILLTVFFLIFKKHWLQILTLFIALASILLLGIWFFYNYFDPSPWVAKIY
jgi:hypothetical protein